MASSPSKPPQKTRPVAASGGPTNMATSAEMQAWIVRLEGQTQSLGRRNKLLAVVLVAGVAVLLAVLAWLYQAAVGSYAVLDKVEISRHAANQGRLQISFQVT